MNSRSKAFSTLITLFWASNQVAVTTSASLNAPSKRTVTFSYPDTQALVQLALRSGTGMFDAILTSAIATPVQAVTRHGFVGTGAEVGFGFGVEPQASNSPHNPTMETQRCRILTGLFNYHLPCLQEFRALSDIWIAWAPKAHSTTQRSTTFPSKSLQTFAFGSNLIAIPHLQSGYVPEADFGHTFTQAFESLSYLAFSPQSQLG